MQVKLRQLRAFDAIVRLGSFADAARALHVTPAALSQAIRELEDSLGFRVLERTTRSLRLTEAGRGFLPFAQRVVTGLGEAERFAREQREGHGAVRIATTPTVLATLLASALPDLRARWPRVRLHPLDVAAADIADALARRQADLAIGVRLPSDSQVTCGVLFASRWFAFVARAHPLARRKRVAWSELAAHRLLMTQTTQLALQGALGGSVRLDAVDDATTVSAGLAMASAGDGAAVFPGYAQPVAQVMGLRAIPVGEPDIEHVLQIAWSRQASTPAPLGAIGAAIVDAVARRCRHLR